MDQLILFVLVVIGSIISSIIQQRNKRKEEEQDSPGTGVPPVPSWPKGVQDWQEALKRMLEGESQAPGKPAPKAGPAPRQVPMPKSQQPPPPLIRPIIVPKLLPRTAAETSEGDVAYASPLQQSAAGYKRAAELHEKVEERLRAVHQQTSAHHSAPAERPGRRAPSRLLPNLRHPESLRQAFVASLIFGPPVGLSRPEPAHITD